MQIEMSTCCLLFCRELKITQNGQYELSSRRERLWNITIDSL